MSKNYSLVVFDLDGTLYDSFLSITKTFQHTLREICGIEENDLEKFRDYIGPPLVDTLSSYGLEGDRLEAALKTYRSYYFTTLGDTVLYDGICDLLDSLKAADIRLAIASSKLTSMVEYILRRDGLYNYFEFIAGISDGQRETKTQAIGRVLKHCGVGRDCLSSAVMVGDRMFDAVGAQNNGIDFIAAGYGPGVRAEFDPYPVVLYAESALDIKKFLLGQRDRTAGN